MRTGLSLLMMMWTNLVKGTFMEKADRIQVSAYTGKNIDVLKQMIVDKVGRQAPDARRRSCSVCL